MKNVTAEVRALHEKEMLEEIDYTVEAEDALLQSKMSIEEKQHMRKLQSTLIQSLFAEADARLQPNQSKDRKSKIVGSKAFSEYREKMCLKYIVPAMVKSNGTIN